jgi:outer membrane protein assembly factor BamB
MLHGYNNDNPSYVMAFDGATGEILWHKERPTDAEKRSENRDAYTTPVIAAIDGKPQMIVVGAQFITSHDLTDGGELMRLSGLNANNDKWNRLVASSFVHEGRLIVTSRKNAIFAYDLQKLGLHRDEALLWKFTEQPLPDVPSPVGDGRYVYFSTDQGAVSCLDAKTGNRVWGPEQSGLGTTSSSMVYADGKVYLSDESSATVVLAAGPEFKILALNKLDGSYTLASPAISGNRMYIRTAEYLYCIGNR